MLTFSGSYPGQTVTLTLHTAGMEEPDSVLVFAFHRKELLFTYNRKRGWELPGGKLNPGEWPISAAIREVYEETGAELEAIEPIGQYRVEADGGPPMIKTVYVARVGRMHEQPEGFETDATRLYATPPSHEAVRRDKSFSILLQDEVYPHTLAIALKHPFALYAEEGRIPS